MAKIFLDNTKGITLIDGKRTEKCCSVAGKDFCVQFFPYDNSYNPIFCILSSNSKHSLENAILIRHNNDYILKLIPTKKELNLDTYLSKSFTLDDITHNINCYANHKHTISIETQNEIFYLYPEGKVKDIHAKSIKISNGQLICIDAKLDNKIYFAVLHYHDDYSLLLSLCCDELSFGESGIIVVDYLYDTLQRKCVRVLKFCDDAFVEESRHFEYMNYHEYPDEIIPYVFLESVSCQDEDMARHYLSSTLHEWDYKQFFGDFIDICDYTEYCPCHTTLIYKEDNNCYGKTFIFSVNKGKILSVKKA